MSDTSRSVLRKVFNGDCPTNQLLECHEYSGSSFVEVDGERLFEYRGSTHVGNQVNIYFDQVPNGYFERKCKVMNVSFPAMQGASGALIMTSYNQVVGMLVAKRERELLPAQILTVNLGNNEFEETKFFLPQGLAIHCDEIQQFIQQYV